MNKNKWILSIIIFVVIVGCIIFFSWKNNNSKNNDNYEASRTSQSQSNENATGDRLENDTSQNNVISITRGITSPQPVEEPIASFSTKIYSKDSARQNNIRITCETLNDTIVENGATFSFCDTVGPATSAKGYQEADIFDNKGQKKKGLGGRKLSN